MMKLKRKIVRLMLKGLTQIHRVHVGEMGKDCIIYGGFQTRHGHNLILGDHVRINRNVIIGAKGGVFIDNYSSIGPNVVIYSSNHKYKSLDQRIRFQGDKLKKIYIGYDSWIGANAVILDRVESGAVIGAGEVVRYPIPVNAIFVGGKVIGYRK